MALDQKLIDNLKNKQFTVLNGEYSKNFNIYVIGEKHEEAVKYIMMLLDRSTDNVLGFGIKMGSQKKYGVTICEESEIPEEYRA